MDSGHKIYIIFCIRITQHGLLRRYLQQNEMISPFQSHQYLPYPLFFALAIFLFYVFYKPIGFYSIYIDYYLNNGMGKKTKSKARLDTYYHFAKQQGYRSRAAYKLIQLNRKYNFLTNSSVLIDLCAAPGGWMQVASECMPLNSTIVGVDLDPIKRVPGTTSFQGDITTPQCYEQLRKQTKNQKCDVVLNDGAPNVGANWSKDAYSQSELVLAALKLSCSFLREGGFFITKVFRSTDFQSLMWVFKKFFEKVEATKPKASRFSSAQIFVVCAGYLAPSFIDEKLFDAKHIFKDTEADHFHDQLAGQITSIDKLLEQRRKRGGYEDNAPMHLYKEVSLTTLIESETPILLFAQYNKITVSNEQRSKYYQLVKNRPADLDELFDDIKVLGKRQINSILKWRGKIRHYYFLESEKADKQELQAEEEKVIEQEVNSEEQLEKQVLSSKRREIKQIKQKEDKRSALMIKSQLADQQHHSDQDQFGQQVGDVFDSQMEQLEYEEQPQQLDQKKEDKKKFAIYNPKDLQRNLQQIYEARKQIREQKQQKIRDAKQRRKDRRQQRFVNQQQKLKSRKFGVDPTLVKSQKHHQQEMVDENDEREDQEDEESIDLTQIKFKNPLADLDDEDLYISENENSIPDNVEVDPNEKMEGEVSDDEAYIIPKPLTDMEKRRQQIKRNAEKKQKKLKKDIEDGEEVGGQIEIVKHKKMQDYNIDDLAQTLVLAKKMLRNRGRQEIIESTYSRFNFQDHDNLPKWFAEDEKKHNFKKLPITKEEFRQEKERLMAINARVPKKIMEAKVRKKIRVQRKLKKVQKQAQTVMSQDGVTEYNKLRQVSRMYDKEKRELKDNKRYVIGKKSTAAAGKDSRGVRHVDKRLKKDKRSEKIKKTRHVHRKGKKRGKF